MALFRYFIAAILFSVISWGCAVCKLQVPDVNVSVTESHADSTITLDFHWQFQKYFSAETLLSYDKNRNEVLDPQEIDAIHANFIEYLDKSSYLTFIKYVKDINAYEQSDYLPFEVTSSKTDFVNDQLFFTYTVTLQTPPREDETLFITLFDEQKFFKFTLSKVTLQDQSLMKSVFTSEYSASFVPYGDPAKVSGDTVQVIEVSGSEIYEEEENLKVSSAS